MERVEINNTTCIIGYHTQEYRPQDDALTKPIKCDDPKAWLGIGYYFWTDLQYAKYWGEDKKLGTTGAYDVYCAYIETNNLINAVFDERGYTFFVEKIEKAIQHLLDDGVSKVTIEKVHRYLAENIWKEIGIFGIIYDDLPTNPKDNPERRHSEIHPLYYKKRIQIVAFDLKIINNFDIYLEAQYVA